MKKYLISGFNTVQEVKLEAGTYTLVAYAKSMYSNVYTFALGDGENWTEYDIDVVQGQLCKVWLTFTIDKKATKFKPIANNFSESLPVYVTDLQLTKGNIPVEAGASPFDIDQILNDLHDGIDAIEDFAEGAFLDGLLSREEKTQLRASLDSIGSIVESVKGSYNKLLDNPFIHENTMDNITARYYAFIASWISDGDPRGLKPVILWIVNGDNIVDQNERDEKDRALNAFNLALYEYNQAEKEVYNDVGENSIAPTIDENGMWAFWSTELQEFIPSEFSAEGDDGHSPYIDVLTGTWWEWNPTLNEYQNTGVKAEGKDGEDGEDGKDGEDGYSVLLSKETHSYAYDKNNNLKGLLSDGATTISVQKGDILFKCDTTSIGGAPVTNNTYRVIAIDVYGVSYSLLTRGIVNDEFKIWPSAFAGETGSMTFTIRAVSDGVVSKDFKKTISFSKNRDGADGEDGIDGIDGEPPKILNGYPKTQYAIGDSKTIYPTSGWGEAIIDVTESKPYLWSRQEIKYDSGDTLYTGYLMLTNITPIAYMAGEWDLRVAYTRNDKSYPIVTYKKGTNNRPLYYYPKKEGVIGYEYFVTPPTEPSSGWYKKGDIVWYENTDEDYPVILGLYKANKNTRFNPYSDDWENVTSLYAPNGVEGQKLWEFADGVELIITEALMANFAKLDSFVFHKGKMFSQEGTLRGVAGSNEYTDDDHIPNFEVDGVTGKVKMKDADIEGTITGSVFTSTDGRIVIDGVGNIIAIKDESGGVKTLITPNNIPPISDYFTETDTIYKELSSLEGTYTDRTQSVSMPMSGVGVDWGEGDTLISDLYVSGFTLSAEVGIQAESVLNWAESVISVDLLKDGVVFRRLGQHVSRVEIESWENPPKNSFITSTSFPPVFMTVQGKSTWTVRVTHKSLLSPINDNKFTTTSSIYGLTEIAASRVINHSEIGANGMVIATSKENYQYMVQNLFEVRKANVGFRVTANGVQMANDMNTPTPTWKNVKTD